MTERMADQHERFAMLVGKEKTQRLSGCRVAVFGLGGVGGGVVEALARSGVGALDLIDHDTVSVTNLNRQLIALHENIGRYKADVAAERIAQIDPGINVRTYKVFYLPETADQFDFSQYDYVLDAIDTVTGKLRIIEEAKRSGVPVISVMGCGNRLDPTKLVVTDLFSTQQDPLARIMRRELRKRGIDKLTVVYSTEPARSPLETPKEKDTGKGRRDTPGSCAWVPPVAGMIAASVVVRDLIKE